MSPQKKWKITNEEKKEKKIIFEVRVWILEYHVRNLKRKLKVEAGYEFELKIHKIKSEKWMKFEVVFEFEKKKMMKFILLLTLSAVS